jgi:hypothetical protein
VSPLVVKQYRVRSPDPVGYAEFGQCLGWMPLGGVGRAISHL